MRAFVRAEVQKTRPASKITVREYTLFPNPVKRQRKVQLTRTGDQEKAEDKSNWLVNDASAA